MQRSYFWSLSQRWLPKAIKADVTIIVVHRGLADESKNSVSQPTVEATAEGRSMFVISGNCERVLRHFNRPVRDRFTTLNAHSLKHNGQIPHEPSEMNFADYGQQNLISYGLVRRATFCGYFKQQSGRERTVRSVLLRSVLLRNRAFFPC